jgi:hypothetical protein
MRRPLVNACEPDALLNGALPLNYTANNSLLEANSQRNSPHTDQRGKTEIHLVKRLQSDLLEASLKGKSLHRNDGAY